MITRLAALVVWLSASAYAAPLPADVQEALANAHVDRKAAILAVEAAVPSADPEDRPRLVLHAGEQRRLAGDEGAARRWFEQLVESKSAEGTAARLALALISATARPSESVRRAVVEAPDRGVLASLDADRLGLLARWAERTEDGKRLAAEALDRAVPGQVERLRDDLERAALVAAAPRALRSVSAAPVRPGAVGVLLPLTGRYASVGAQVRDALEEGWRAGGGPVQLVMADTEGSPAGAAAALRRLVEVDHVGAVLGPLLTPEMGPTIEVAEALGVPLVLMSQGMDDVVDLDWVLQGWITPAQQIDVLLQYAMEVADHERFAVVAPDSDYGKAAAARFTDEVKRRGGSISIAVTYPSESSDLKSMASAVARASPGAPPTVDYDAIFVPDRARQVPLVAAALAVQDVPLGTYKPYDDGPIPLLGLSGWNSWDLIAGGGAYVANARFTDVFVAPPETGLQWTPRPAWKTFVDAFRDAKGRTPTQVEALAYDAAAIVAVAASTRPATREAFFSALLAAQRASSVTGASSFDPTTRSLRHRIEVISVSRGGLAPLGDP